MCGIALMIQFVHARTANASSGDVLIFISRKFDNHRLDITCKPLFLKAPMYHYRADMLQD